MPSVSIILPTYNRAAFVPQALEAIRTQLFTDWELIVIDDGSTDKTRDLVMAASASISQSVRYVYQQNQGAYGARNSGLNLVRGTYVAFYDSDDVWLPHHLQDCVRALEANPEVDWVYGSCRAVELATGRVIAPSTFYMNSAPRPFRRLRHRSAGALRIIDDPAATACMIRDGLFCGLQNSVIRNAVFERERFHTDFRNEAEDQLMVVRALAAGRRFAYFDNVHVIYHEHDQNSSASGTDRRLEKHLEIFRAEMRGYENLGNEVPLTTAERRVLRKRLSDGYFWALGYALLWRNGRRGEALAMYRRGLRLWPWNWRCWKTYLAARARVAIPEGMKRFWWWATDGEYRRTQRANRLRIQSFRSVQRHAVGLIRQQKGDCILAGPFEGLQYTPCSDEKSYSAHILLGTYEKELRPVFEEVRRRGYDKIVDIGAAEGFYVCGLAMCNPRARVIGFEANQQLHGTIQELARANSVDNVEVRAECSAPALQALLLGGGRAFVLCDIDGGEVELLDPETVPSLKAADILVETHDLLRPNVTDLLLDRFKGSHRICVIETARRTLADLPAEVELEAETAHGAMDEFRGGPQRWLWMTRDADRSVTSPTGIA
jgi:glycosyltransferase involved in cell wall biosynthesis